MARERILILETDKDLLTSRTKSLSREGYMVVGVSSVERALEAMSEQSYELLIVRPEAPDLINMLLVRFPADIAVIIIASQSNIGRVAEGSGIGVHSFLIEPFTAHKLHQAVTRSLSGRRAVIDKLRDHALTIFGQARHLPSPNIDLEGYFRIVAEMSAVGTGADCVSLVMKDDLSHQYVTGALYGKAVPGFDELCAQFSGSSEVVLVFEGCGTHSEIYPRLAEAGVSSIMSVPLTIKGEVIGALRHLRSEGKKPFTAADMNFASVLTWWIGVSLENLRLFQKVEQQRGQVDSLLKEVSHAQENERKRMAIEIHDGVAQWMVGATYSIKACSALISESRLSELQVELAKIGQTLQKSIRELRRTIANLRPLALEEGGLTTAIRQTAQPLIEEGINCRFHIDSELPVLTFPQETTTYWILQEALSNIRSHAGATELDIHIGVKNGQMHVTVMDNGRGFNPEEIFKSAIPLEHMGLLGMQERARLLGGNLIIDSSSGRGTTVHFSFPLSSYEPVNATI